MGSGDTNQEVVSIGNASGGTCSTYDPEAFARDLAGHTGVTDSEYEYDDPGSTLHRQHYGSVDTGQTDKGSGGNKYVVLRCEVTDGTKTQQELVKPQTKSDRGLPAKKQDLKEFNAEPVEEITTLMVRGIPCSFSPVPARIALSSPPPAPALDHLQWCPWGTPCGSAAQTCCNACSCRVGIWRRCSTC